MISYFKKAIDKIKSRFEKKEEVSGAKNLESIEDFKKVLLDADLGIETTKECLNYLKSLNFEDNLDIKKLLKLKLKQILGAKSAPEEGEVCLIFGVNGSGKTTFSAKLANFHKAQNKKVLITESDTFRAAANEQIGVLSGRIGVDCFCGKQDQDPSSVIFGGCKKFEEEHYDTLIIDTSGRLQSNVNLIKELQKINRVIKKVLPEKKVVNLLVIDSIIGQNSIEQAKIFHDTVGIHGLVITKTDITEKGGIIFTLKQKLNIPVVFLSFGEEMKDIKRFDPEPYVESLVNSILKNI